MSPTAHRRCGPGGCSGPVGELQARLDDDGRATLRQLGITDVADLRARREVARRGPGLVPGTVEIHLLPFPRPSAPRSPTTTARPRTKSPCRNCSPARLTDQPEQSRQRGRHRLHGRRIREFPTRNGAQQALHHGRHAAGRRDHPGTDALLRGQGPHGFVVATILETIGIDRDTIVADFLRSDRRGYHNCGRASPR